MRWTVGILLLFSFGAFATPKMWSAGQTAIGTDVTLQKSDPIAIALPELVAEKITQKTALLYFSPLCPHCQAVMPEINQLAKDVPNIKFIAVATSSSTKEQIEAFKEAYQVEIEIVMDREASFAMALGARATPNLYIVEPKPESLVEETEDNQKKFLLLDAYLPYSRGLAGIINLRNETLEEPFANFEGYQGSRVCINCHQQEGNSWIMTHHAQAYYTIFKNEKTDDQECVSCHVTGLGEDKGFVMGDHRSPMAGVGCESCHSASGPHDGKNVNAKESCQNCHDEKHSINFSVEKGLPHIDHYIANTLSDDEFRKRVEAISEGTAPKPLLSFAAGDTVGSKTCLSCHQETHAKDPHQKAMKTLARKQRDNTECQACHATAKTMGVGEPTEFHNETGVGCESCHGSGADHAKAPTKENIVGLGDSCPVCVIEAVCTSCHTPKWDSKWDLDTRLEQFQKY